MKKTLFLLCLIGCWLTTRSVSAQFYGEVPLYFSEQLGTVTVSWEHIPGVLYYNVVARGDIQGEWRCDCLVPNVSQTVTWTLYPQLGDRQTVSVEIYAVGGGYNYVRIARGSYTKGIGSSSNPCPKSMGTLKASFRYYYDLQQHQWAAIVYVDHVPADGPENMQHRSFMIQILKDGQPFTHSYCSYGSGYVYLSDPRGDYHVKIIADDGCPNGSENHYLKGYFQIIRESPDEAGITLMEYFQ